MRTVEELEAELETVKHDRDIWKERFEDIRRQKTDLMFQLFDAQERGRAVNIEPVLHENVQLKVMVAKAERERDELREYLHDAGLSAAGGGARMKTIEELEAQLEGARVMIDSLTRSLALAEAEIAVVRKELRATRKERDEARAETRLIDESFQALLKEYAKVSDERDFERQNWRDEQERADRILGELRQLERAVPFDPDPLRRMKNGRAR